MGGDCTDAQHDGIRQKSLEWDTHGSRFVVVESGGWLQWQFETSLAAGAKPEDEGRLGGHVHLQRQKVELATLEVEL